MQSLLSNHRAQATRKPCLNSHNRDHSRKLVSVEGGDCSKRSNFFGWLPKTKNGPSPKKGSLFLSFFSRVTEQLGNPKLNEIKLFWPLLKGNPQSLGCVPFVVQGLWISLMAIWLNLWAWNFVEFPLDPQKVPSPHTPHHQVSWNLTFGGPFKRKMVQARTPRTSVSM